MKAKLILPISICFVMTCSCNNEVKTDSSSELVSEEVQIEEDEKPIVEVDQYPEYTELKNTAEYFGQWTITNNVSHITYFYEIYTDDDEITGVARTAEYGYDILKKDGDKYIVQDNAFGEYYIIDDNMWMRLFDKDGSLGSSGWHAVYNPEKL